MVNGNDTLEQCSLWSVIQVYISSPPPPGARCNTRHVPELDILGTHPPPPLVS
jgi:hypothetical protein